MGHVFRNVATARVLDDQDPEKRGRLKVEAADVLDEEEQIPVWAEPCFAYAGNGYGLFLIPEIGDLVEVEYVTGTTSDDFYGEAAARNLDLRWRCATFRGLDEVPDEFSGDNYPNRLGVKTAAGNVIVLDDSADNIVIIAPNDVKVGRDEQGSYDAAMLFSKANSDLKDIESKINALIDYVTAPADPNNPGNVLTVDSSTHMVNSDFKDGDISLTKGEQAKNLKAEK